MGTGTLNPPRFLPSFFACFFAAILIVAPLLGQKDDDLDKALSKLGAASPSFAAGLRDFAAGRLDKAEKAFAGCVDKFPSHAYARYYLANILFLRRDYAASLEQMELALAHLDLMKVLGERAEQRKIAKLGELRASLDAMWEAADHTSEPCRNRRSIEWDKREVENEAFQAEKAVAEKEAAFGRVKAHYTYFLGNILFRLQRTPEAFRRYEEAVRIDPRHADAYNNLIAISYIARQYAVAQAFLEQAERQGLDESLNLELKERLFKALGRPVEGILFEDIPVPEQDALRVRRFALAYQPEPVGTLKIYVNAYIVFSPRTRDAILIDPGAKDARLENFVREQGLNVRAILNTHDHFDHFGADAFYAALLRAPVFAPATACRRLPQAPDRFLRNDEVLEFDGFRVRVVQTPGHSPESLCFLVGKVLFSGDTLYRGDIGRVEHEESVRRDEALAAMIKVIRAKLLTLPDDTVVCPGHGRTTTIGNEKADNPFLAR